MKCMYAARAMAFFLSAAVKKSPPSWEAGKDLPHAGGVGLAGVDLFLYML